MPRPDGTPSPNVIMERSEGSISMIPTFKIVVECREWGTEYYGEFYNVLNGSVIIIDGGPLCTVHGSMKVVEASAGYIMKWLYSPDGLQSLATGKRRVYK